MVKFSKVLCVVLSALMLFGIMPALAEEETKLGRIISEVDFESGNPLKQVPGSNKITMEYSRGTKSNYALISREGEGDCYMQASLAGVPDRVVIEMDVMTDGLSSAVLPFALTSSDTKGNVSNVSILASGYINSSSGDPLGKLELYTWTNLAMALDVIERKFDFYVNGRKTGEDIEFKGLAAEKPANIRIYAGKGSGATYFGVDNFAIYEATAPITKEKREEIANSLDRESAYMSNEKVKEFLKGMSAVNGKTGMAYAEGEEVKADTLFKEGVVYTDVDFAAKALSISAADVTNTVAAVEENGKKYVSLKPLAEARGKKVFEDGEGVIVIGDSEFAGVQREDIREEVRSFLTYQRPSREQLKADFIASGSHGTHPRLMIKPSDVERMKKYIKDGNEFMVSGYKRILNTADGYLTAPPVQYILSGSQLLSQSRLMLSRSEYLGLAYVLSDDAKYAEALYKNLESVANFVDWNHHTHYLDTGEMAAAFSIGYDFIYNYLTKERREFLSEALKKHVIRPARATQYSAGFKYVNNWNSVVNGGIAMSALCLADEEGYEDIAFDTLEKAIRGLEYMMVEYGPDGGWEESSGYWALATRYTMRMLSSLESACGSNYGLTDVEGFKNTGMFAVYVCGPVGLNNYHDASFYTPDWDSFMWFASSFEDESYAILRNYNLKTYSKLPGPYDMMFYDEKYGDNSDISKIKSDGYIGQVELIHLRSDWNDKGAMYVGAHGGYGQVPHWNLDSGTFVLDAMGERFASDLGTDSYSLDGYINTKSYLYYRKRTEGQNCVVINPDETMGQVYTAFSPVTKYVSKEKGSFAIYDLSDAYAENAKSFKRGFMLGDNRRTVTIRDEITLGVKDKNEVYWFMHTEAVPEILEGNKILLTIGSKKLLMECAVEGSEKYEISVVEAVPLPLSPNPEGQGDNSKYKKIQIKVTGGSDVAITTKFTPYQLKEYIPAFDKTPLDKWNIEDGAAVKKPVLQMIYADGKPIEKFAPENSEYDIILNHTVEKIPEITAKCADEFETEIIGAKDMNSSATIIVKSKEDKSVVNIYTVNLNQLKKPEDVDGRERYAALSVEASDIPQEENGPLNIIDGDLSTRWSAQGYGVWIMEDLGTEQEIYAFGVSYHNGASRIADFEIEVSNDGNVFEKVFVGKSEQTNDIAIYSLKEPVKARYVKIISNGTTGGMWNSITEFAPLGNK